MRDAKGATALLCANAMGFTTNKRPYQWCLKEKAKGQGQKATLGLPLMRKTTLLC